jgi:prolyl-tRNA synthetase
MGRDFEVEAVGDLREITADDPCPNCNGRLELTEGIEVGHVFKLGTKYSEAMKAVFQDSDGLEKPFIMGCYGIGITRVVAAAIEQNHDDHGIVFPLPLAPFKIIILNLDPKDEAITHAAETIYRELQKRGVETLIDDRDERPGSKFKDADLLGIPYRIMVGKRFAKDGVVEIRRRRDGVTEEAGMDAVVDVLQKKIASEMKDLG